MASWLTVTSPRALSIEMTVPFSEYRFSARWEQPEMSATVSAKRKILIVVLAEKLDISL